MDSETIHYYVKKFELENHLDKYFNHQRLGEFYRKRLDDLQSIANILGLPDIDVTKMEIELLEEVLCRFLVGFPPLRNYIEENKPLEFGELNEGTKKNVIKAFCSLVVDKYKKQTLH